MNTVPTACLALLCAGVQAEPPPDVTVHLHGGLPWHQTQVRLGDIAHVRTHDLPQAVALVNLTLARRSPDRGLHLDRAAIGAALQHELGIAPDRIHWSGLEQVTAGPWAGRTPAEHAVQLAREELERWLRGRATAFHVTAEETSADLPAGVSRMVARPVPAGTRVGSSMVVWVDHWSAQGEQRTLPVRLAVEVYAGRSVPEAETARTPTPVAALRGRGTAPGPSARPLGSAAESRAPLATRGPEVKRGDWVTLTYAAGDVQIERRAEALHAAARGDRVRVRPAGDGTDLLGRVAGPGLVELTP